MIKGNISQKVNRKACSANRKHKQFFSAVGKPKPVDASQKNAKLYQITYANGSNYLYTACQQPNSDLIAYLTDPYGLSITGASLSYVNQRTGMSTIIDYAENCEYGKDIVFTQDGSRMYVLDDGGNSGQIIEYFTFDNNWLYARTFSIEAMMPDQECTESSPGYIYGAPESMAIDPTTGNIWIAFARITTQHSILGSCYNLRTDSAYAIFNPDNSTLSIELDSSQFFYPEDPNPYHTRAINFAPDGALYIAGYGDGPGYFGYTVYKGMPGNTFEIFAGQDYGQGGHTGDGGPATEATLNLPWGVAIDENNNVYISESGNRDIRVVNSAGIIDTLIADVGYNPRHLKLGTSSEKPLLLAMDGLGENSGYILSLTDY
ncbi:MAG: hypothetical protein AAF518_15200 [Spirochaetota bacterium]